MKKLFFVLLMLCSPLVFADILNNLPLPEHIGTVDEWAPGQGFIVVDGERYEVDASFRVLGEQDSDLLVLESVQPGMTVMVSATGGKAFAVFLREDE